MELYHFLPYFKDYESITCEEFQHYIRDNRQQFEIPNTKLFVYQQFHTKYISPDTPYDRLLLFADPGTGKTLSYISIVEHANTTKKAILLVKNSKLKFDLYRKIIHEMEFNYNTKEDVHRRYDIYTFGEFISYLRAYGYLYQGELIEKEFSNRYIIIDEAHHIRENVELYKPIHFFLHNVNSKIILSTGTPIIDQSNEIASLLNLLLPSNQQINISDFDPLFFDQNNQFQNHELFAQYCKGIVSRVKKSSNELQPTKQYIGTLNGSLQHTITVSCPMSDIQYNLYRQIYEKDDHTIYVKSRQASIFAFPDLKLKQYMNMKTMTIAPVFQSLLLPNLLEQIGIYSAKFKFILSNILKYPNAKHFIYCKFVRGSGLLLLASLLKLFDYEQYSKYSSKRCFALLTGNTDDKETKQILHNFNDPSNKYGQQIHVILGSLSICEGITLNNVQHVYIVSPNWNQTEIHQAIARTVRIHSHSDLFPNERHVCVYQLMVTYKDEVMIDEMMYKIAETKMIKNNQIDQLLDQYSIDHLLEYHRYVEPTNSIEELERNRFHLLVDPSYYDMSYVHSLMNEQLNIHIYKNILYRGDRYDNDISCMYYNFKEKKDNYKNAVVLDDVIDQCQEEYYESNLNTLYDKKNDDKMMNYLNRLPNKIQKKIVIDTIEQKETSEMYMYVYCLLEPFITETDDFILVNWKNSIQYSKSNQEWSTYITVDIDNIRNSDTIYGIFSPDKQLKLVYKQDYSGVTDRRKWCKGKNIESWSHDELIYLALQYKIGKDELDELDECVHIDIDKIKSTMKKYKKVSQWMTSIELQILDKTEQLYYYKWIIQMTKKDMKEYYFKYLKKNNLLEFSMF